jgi:tape measure domain-containing protein
MATLGIVVKSDFDQASKDLKEFKASSESTAKSIKKFQDSFKAEQIDKFLDKQKLSSTALKATRGELSANQSEFRALRSEIEKLIKRGIDPQDESIKKLTTRYDQLGKEIDQATKEQDEFRKSSKQTTGVMAEIGKIAAGISVAGIFQKGFSAVKDFGKFALQSAGKFEQVNIAFKTFLGSADKARKIVGDLQKFSAVTPFTQEQVLDAGKALLAFGIEAGNVEDKLKAIGDLSAGTGKDFNELAVIFGKAKTQGRLFAEDINQLTEGGIPIIQEFAKQLGVSNEEVKKLASEGKITFKNLDRAFKDLTGSSGKFFNLTKNQSESFLGTISTLQSNLQNFAIGFGDKLIKRIQPLVEFTNDLLVDEIDLTQVTKDLIKANREYASVTKTLADESKNLGEKEKQKLEVRKAELRLDVAKNISKINKLYAEQRRNIPDLKKNIKQLNEQRKELSDLISNQGKYNEFQTKGNVIYNKAGIGITTVTKKSKEFNAVNEKAAELSLKLKKSQGEFNDALKTLAFALKNELITKADLAGINKGLVKQAIELSKSEKLIADEKKKGASATAEKVKLTSAEKKALEALKQKAIELGIAEASLTGLTLEQVKQRIEAFKKEQEVKQTLLQTGFDLASTLSDALFEKTKANREKDLENANEFSAQLMELDEQEAKSNREKLLKEIKDAEAAGDKELANEKRLALKRADLQKKEKERERELAKTAFEENKNASVKQALINTALAVGNALATVKPFIPKGLAAAGLATFKGLAEVARIRQQSFQTGTSNEGLTVRSDTGRTGQDPVNLRVNEDENVKVTTRGEDTGAEKTTNIFIGEEQIFSVVQRGIDNGDINLTDVNIQVAPT